MTYDVKINLILLNALLLKKTIERKIFICRSPYFAIDQVPTRKLF
ncbi:hypothetical protein [Microcoleus sp. bin38.metabat.b11b12b14.051]|nr:hypothetical protein [Microcoleus sp. bin38.metabat.b11b12b14.051]